MEWQNWWLFHYFHTILIFKFSKLHDEVTEPHTVPQFKWQCLTTSDKKSQWFPMKLLTIKRIEWPAKSLDWHSIEILWDRVSVTPKRKFDLPGFRWIFLWVWNWIDRADVRRFNHSIPWRHIEVIEKDEGYTHFSIYFKEFHLQRACCKKYRN